MSYEAKTRTMARTKLKIFLRREKTKIFEAIKLYMSFDNAHTVIGSGPVEPSIEQEM